VASSDQADRYAVVGNPVTHSLSPRIHSSFAEQTGQRISYQAIEIPVDSFAAGVRDLQQRGFQGINVTVPFKREAWELCDRLSGRAEKAGAVNMLSFLPDADISGDNTDGVGLTRDLVNNLQVSIEQRKILVLGAGGAVRGVLGPLLALSPQSLTIANRTLAKATTLAQDFSKQGDIQVIAYDAFGPESFDLVINGTAAGLSDEVPPIPETVVGENTVCYDMMYNIEVATVFVEWSLSHGAARAFDGLGMLVEQAAEAFHGWRNVHPGTAEVIDSLRHK